MLASLGLSYLRAATQPLDGTIVFEQDTAGAWTYTPTWTGYADVVLNGGGGLGGIGGYDKKGSITLPGGGGGGGGYSIKRVAVTAGTPLAGEVGGGSEVSTDGGDTTCATHSMTAHGGTAGPNISGGAGGTASGGDTNTTGQSGGVSNDWDGGSSPHGGATQSTASSAGNAPGGGGSSELGFGAPGRVQIIARSGP